MRDALLICGLPYFSFLLMHLLSSYGKILWYLFILCAYASRCIRRPDDNFSRFDSFLPRDHQAREQVALPVEIPCPLPRRTGASVGHFLVLISPSSHFPWCPTTPNPPILLTFPTYKICVCVCTPLMCMHTNISIHVRVRVRPTVYSCFSFPRCILGMEAKSSGLLIR